MKRVLVLTGLCFAASSALADCPAVTVADAKGVGAGAYPQQYELSEFQTLANCELSFTENPDIAALNGKIRGNPDLPPLAERLPEEPLVVAPYDEIGKHGGTLRALSNATEAGTSDFLSTRHFSLRKGHKWSDGAPFTAEDVKFWYDHLALDSNVIEQAKDYVLIGGERMTVDVVDPQTVRFNLPAPKPGLLAHFATSFAQGFQPKHFLGQFHPDVNPEADALATAAGFENGYDLIKAYWGNSDWTDTPSPLLNSPDKVANLPADVYPTLESHITISDTTEGRRYVANPYFFMVDTQGNQLPYISEQDEQYINDAQVRLLKLVNGEVEYKAQSLQLSDVPLLLENQEKGDYTIDIRPKIAMHAFSFNVTSEDAEKRKVFGDLRFRRAMSIAINRDDLNEVAYFGQGQPQQYIGFSPAPGFVDEKLKSFATEYNLDEAKSLLAEVGLKDTDGDGFLELPNGDKFVLIQTTVKEITPDEYRSAQSSNALDVGMWEKGQPLGIVLGNNELWVAPFENYFAHRVGMLWGEYFESDGAKGVEPPDYVKQLKDDIDAFQSTPVGSAESDEIGARLVQNMVENLLFIGTAMTPDPIYHRNALKNVVEFKTASYEYYRTFPYRAQQWSLSE